MSPPLQLQITTRLPLRASWLRGLLFVNWLIAAEICEPYAARAGDVVAVPPADFLNSLGVCSAVSRRGETLEHTAEATRHVWNISEGGAQSDNVGLQSLVIPPGTDTLMLGDWPPSALLIPRSAISRTRPDG